MRSVLLAATLASLTLTGCRAELSVDGVRDLFDAADRAYLKGDVNAVCDLRTENFVLESTAFDLAHGRTVADRAEADAIEADAAAAGERNVGKREKLDRRSFCMLAFDGRDAARGSRLERGAMDVAIDPRGDRATVRVRYVVLAPAYEAGESVHGFSDASERQAASLRTESEEESIVVRDGGDLKIASTRVTSWSFLVPAVRDSRL